jgi:hypothetical protein
MYRGVHQPGCIQGARAAPDALIWMGLVEGTTNMKIPPEWLTQKVDSAPTSYNRSRTEMSALSIRMAWQKLQRQAGEGGEVWAWANPSSTWKKQGKLSGFALVRDGAIIEAVTLSQE